MKNLILILLLIGLFSSYASADPNDVRKLIEEAEREADRLEKILKKQYGEELQVEQIIKKAQDEVDSDGKTGIFKIDETTLYYLFSTIAQTLAGAFGILGAFTMYRLQSINNACKGIGDIIIDSLKFTQIHLPDIHDAYLNGDWKLFSGAIRKYMNDKERGGKEEFIIHYPLPEKRVYMYCVSLEVLMASYDIIKIQILDALKLTVITISYSLVVLPFSTAVAHYPVVEVLLTAIAIILSIKCLHNYSLLVIDALGLRDGGKKKKQ